MIISEKDWKQYITKLRKINDTAANKIAEYIDNHGLSNRNELLDYAHAVVTKYGEASAALSAQMYDAIAEASGVNVPSAEVADVAEYKDVAKAINGTLKTSNNVNEIAGAATRWVKMAGSDTTLKNALRDRAEFAWIPRGETCAFCLMLASNGWQPMSKKALRKGHAEHIHSNCDCQYAIRFDSRTNVKGYDPDKYKKMFDNAEGDTYKEKLNSIRNMQNQSREGKLEVIKPKSRTQDWMGQPQKEIIRFRDGNGKEKVVKFKSYKYNGYDNIYSQTNSSDAQDMMKYLNENVNNNKYGKVDRIVVVKNKSLEGIALYKNDSNALYISEELINSEKFDKIVAKDVFAARNVDDVLKHELGGHKQHWDAVKRFYSDNKERFSSIDAAKNELESKLFSYINNASQQNPGYLANVVSENAFDNFVNYKRIEDRLNETIADGVVKIQTLNKEDSILADLIKEVINYGKP